VPQRRGSFATLSWRGSCPNRNAIQLYLFPQLYPNPKLSLVQKRKSKFTLSKSGADTCRESRAPLSVLPVQTIGSLPLQADLADHRLSSWTTVLFLSLSLHGTGRGSMKDRFLWLTSPSLKDMNPRVSSSIRSWTWILTAYQSQGDFHVSIIVSRSQRVCACPFVLELRKTYPSYIRLTFVTQTRKTSGCKHCLSFLVGFPALTMDSPVLCVSRKLNRPADQTSQHKLLLYVFPSFQ
jgi:hypothetical protein